MEFRPTFATSFVMAYYGKGIPRAGDVVEAVICFRELIREICNVGLRSCRRSGAARS
jgi:hypothetical protein